MQDPNNLAVTAIAREMVVDVYVFIETLPPSERYNLAEQMRRSASSIPNNINEGCARKSNRDLVAFLRYAAGSARELTGQLAQARDVNVGDQNQARNLHRRAERLRFMLTKLITAIERRLDAEGA